MRVARWAVRDADRRFPVRIRIGVLPHGLGERIDQIAHGLTRITVPTAGG